MPSRYILALDQGTTSSRSMVFDTHGNIVGVAQKEFKQIFPQPGWVEHDAEEIWSTQFGTMAEAVARAKITMKQIAGIGITNQRETTVVWERSSGRPICNAIVWQDRRTAAFCDELKKMDAPVETGHTVETGHALSVPENSMEDFIKQKTGLVIDAYFSGSKLKWILDHIAGARQRAETGELAFGTVDSWLVWKLTGGEVHVTDVSNASRTMLLNIHTGEWDDDLLKIFTVPRSLLPDVKPSSKIYGVTGNIIPDSHLPIGGIAGDQQAALFGQMCTQPGMVKNTYGTGCFMLMNTGAKATASKNNLLTTIAWEIDSKMEYALEGSVFIAGAVVQWLRDGLKIIRTSKDVEELSAHVPDAGGVYVVPAFAGLGAPHWNQHARGTVFGLTRGSSSAHIARAALDSIAYQTYDVLKAMEADAGITISELRVDGGATVNNSLMQFQSDILNCKVVRPRVTETTALGAAYLAGLAVGYWKNIEEIQQQWQVDKVFSPQMQTAKAKDLLNGWTRAVKASIAWSDL